MSAFFSAGSLAGLADLVQADAAILANDMARQFLWRIPIAEGGKSGDEFAQYWLSRFDQASDVRRKAMVTACIASCFFPQRSGSFSHMPEIPLDLIQALFMQPVPAEHIQPQ